MKLRGNALPLVAVSVIGLAATQTSSADLFSYWPIEEDSFSGHFMTQNLVPGGYDGLLTGTVEFFTDPERGQVLKFYGGGYVDAGYIPQQTRDTDFTWSFWALNEISTAGDNGNTVIVGNRFNGASNTEFSPREFIKFTPTRLQYYHSGNQNNQIEYRNFSNPSEWIHVSAVKKGDKIVTYHNGLVQDVKRITGDQNNAMPLFFGGNGLYESWIGQLDDVALWDEALPLHSILRLASGAATPLNVSKETPTLTTVYSDDFSAGLDHYNLTDRGLEANGPAGYDPQVIIGNQLVLGGIAGAQHWYGSSVETMRFSSSVETMITVDRVSLDGIGTGFRSSLWVFGDEGHYLHFSHNAGTEANALGWSWNANDEGGVGTMNPIKNGNNIADLDPFDGSFGTHTLGIHVVPTGVPGAVSMFMYFDGDLVAARGFTAFPDEFSIILTGQARAIGDSVTAVFDNLVVMQVPEPSAAGLVFLGAMVVGLRRRSK